MMIEITTHADSKKWTEFVGCSKDSSIYHRPEWRTFLEETFGYKPFHLFARNECGDLVGLLPLFYIDSMLTGNRLCTSPFGYKCGILGQTEAQNELLDHSIGLSLDINAHKLEIRDRVISDKFRIDNLFSTHVLTLTMGLEDIWKNLDRGSVRWAINRSKKEGIRVNISKDLEDFKNFYELNSITKQRIGVPCHPWKFFKNMFFHLNDYISLYYIRHDEMMIGGAIMLYSWPNVIYGYGAADPDKLNLHPYNAILWEAIKDAFRNGYEVFDFGRTSNSNKGLMDFKSRWGTYKESLYYSIYPNHDRSKLDDRNSVSWRLGSKLIRMVPRRVYKGVSDATFYHFG